MYLPSVIEMYPKKVLVLALLAFLLLFRPCISQCNTPMECSPAIVGFSGLLTEISCTNQTCVCGGPCFEADESSSACKLMSGCWRLLPQDGSNSGNKTCVAGIGTFFELASNVLFAISAVVFAVPLVVTVILIVPVLRYHQHGIRSKSYKYIRHIIRGSFVVCWTGTIMLIIAGIILRAFELRERCIVIG